jgi:RHS repeat-associated protein
MRPRPKAILFSSTTTHGFTGHEHVDGFGFIHMNGRIYDPQLGKMLQADPVQNAGSQALNRYAYVANNPLTLTDPSGYSWFSSILKIAAVAIVSYVTFGAAYGYLVAAGWSSVAAGAAAGALTGFITGVMQTGTLQGGLYGAFSGAIFGGIGCAFAPGSGFSVAKTAANASAGGVISVLEGCKFGNGFFSAGLSAALMPSIGSISNGAARYVVAALVGGTASIISGGKFESGAATAVMQLAVQDAAGRIREDAYARRALAYNRDTALALNKGNDFETIRTTNAWAAGKLTDEQYKSLMCPGCGDPTFTKLAVFGTVGIATFGVGIEFLVLPREQVFLKVLHTLRKSFGRWHKGWVNSIRSQRLLSRLRRSVLHPPSSAAMEQPTRC